MAYKRVFHSLVVTSALVVGVAFGQGETAEQSSENPKEPLTIAEQGAYAFGGKVLGDFETESLHCDHGYVEYQIPVNAREVSLLMWHSSSTKTWETTFAGEEGFKNIFLRRGYPEYIIDPPRVGRAGWGCEAWAYEPDLGRDQRQVSSWRLGTWDPPNPPEYFPNVQFPVDDPEAIDEVLRARYPEFETVENAQLETDEVAKLADEIGPVTVITHSGSGIRGWLMALKSQNVAAVVSYEPASFVFPVGEPPPSVVEGFEHVEVPLAEFERLTEIPIQIVFGDNIDQVPFWVPIFENAQAFVEAVNRHGGEAELLHLPELGISGNTHFPMSDLNNIQVADLLSEFLQEKGLAERGGTTGGGGGN